MKRNIKETKRKILDALEGVKEFEVSYGKEVFYSKTFKAKSKEELEKKWDNVELEFGNKDIYEETFLDGSLDIEEV